MKPGFYTLMDTHRPPPYTGPVDVVLMGDIIDGPRITPKDGQSYRDAVLEGIDAAQETLRMLIETGQINPLDPRSWDPPLSLLEQDARYPRKHALSELPDEPAQP